MKDKWFVCLFVAAGLLVSSCVTTNVAGIWKDDAYITAPMKKTMVMGVFKEDELRKAMENQLVAQINRRGGNAFSSYKVFQLDKVVDKAFLSEKLQEIKADSILVMRVVDKDETGVYIPGEIYDNPPDYYHNFYEFTNKMYDDIIRVKSLSPLKRRSNDPKHEVLTTEVNIYSTETAKLNITITFDTEFMRRTEKVVEKLAETTAENLSKQNILVE
jgi:hypothetical protein